MDYEKKYNETLERAKSIKDSIIASNNKESARYYTGFIDNIFPELKESEDERIRKALIQYLKDYPVNLPNGLYSRYDFFTYLEKQKEQKPVKLDDDTEIGLDRALQIVKAANGNLRGYQSDDGIYECCHAIQTLERILKNGIEQKPAEQLSGTFTSYDMAKTFTEEQNYVIAHPEKFGLCKPAEWSEEDEKVLNQIIFKFQHDGGCVYQKEIDWLKSLRPQPRWKPSEEEIGALERAIIKMHTPTDIDILAELRDNLKKL